MGFKIQNLKKNSIMKCNPCYPLCFLFYDKGSKMLISSIAGISSLIDKNERPKNIFSFDAKKRTFTKS